MITKLILITVTALVVTALTALIRRKKAEPFAAWMNAEGYPVLILAWFGAAALLSAFGPAAAHLLLTASQP